MPGKKAQKPPPPKQQKAETKVEIVVAKPPAKPQAKKAAKPAEKKKQLNATQRGFRDVVEGGITGALDLVGGIHPKVYAAREGIRALTGFNERAVTVGKMSSKAQGGGPVVQTMNAPVAFARQQTRVFKKTVKATNESQTEMICDLIGPLVPPSTASTYTVCFNAALAPVYSACFPNFYTEYEDWERWRPLALRIHYCHYAPTSTQCAIALAFNEDNNATELAGVDSTMSKLAALTYFAQGSAYEDFSLSVKPPMWNTKQVGGGEWLYLDTSSGSDARQNSPGVVIVAVDQNTANLPSLGYLYLELMFEVTGRRPPYVGVGLLTKMARSMIAIPDDQREAYLKWCGQRLVEDLSKIRPSQATVKQDNNLFADFKSTLLVRPPLPTQLSTQQLTSSPSLARRN